MRGAQQLTSARSTKKEINEGRKTKQNCLTGVWHQGRSDHGLGATVDVDEVHKARKALVKGGRGDVRHLLGNKKVVKGLPC